MSERNPLSDFVPSSLNGVAALYVLVFPNGRKYIGISSNPKKRLRQHKAFALRGSTNPVHRAIRKWGIVAVRQDILAIGQRSYILDLEAKAISALNTVAPRGYNLMPGGEANPMDVPESREKMIRALTGRKDPEDVKQRKKASWTPERRANMSAVHKGKVISDSQKKSISLCHTGKSVSAKARENNGAAQRARWARTKGTQ